MPTYSARVSIPCPIDEANGFIGFELEEIMCDNITAKNQRAAKSSALDRAYRYMEYSNIVHTPDKSWPEPKVVAISRLKDGKPVNEKFFNGKPDHQLVLSGVGRSDTKHDATATSRKPVQTTAPRTVVSGISLGDPLPSKFIEQIKETLYE